ncbi:TMEM164 family acyltransferase [Haloplasma contractile]|uniref:Integral membrane protein n=1 Tax=Haloplasma contractile SSD-17B TaxID=1033810 RepID=F7PW35_9MOLU|nr:YwaF family protein [Haloplasma contractile]ERJ12879.1 Integral membrane protein [Haloplasma contractile SSD-17B]
MNAQFEMWSYFHYFMIVFPFILTIILYLYVRKKSYSVKRNIALLMGIIMVIILALRQIYIFNKDGGLSPEVIPFQVCHFANFTMLLVAINKRYRVIGAISWCLNFPAGLASVIFADGLENYSNVLNMQGIAYILGHMLIVSMGLYLLLTKMIKINLKTLFKMYKVVTVLFLASVLINNWFIKIFNEKSNYFYTYTPEKGTPLEDLFNLGLNYELLGITFNPIYLLLLAGVGFILTFIMFLISKIRYIRFE